MAVPKKKISRARRDTRRRNNSKHKWPSITVDPSSGEHHIRHRVSALGFYKGKKVL